MRWIVDLFTHVRASNLGQDAVIEIMIALLGVMVAVLTLISGLLALFLAVMGFFGFQSIKEEAKRVASSIAETEARNTIRKEIDKLEDIDLLAALGTSDEPKEVPRAQPQPQHSHHRRKTSDNDLKGKKK